MDVKMGRYLKASVICWHKKDQGEKLGSKKWFQSKDRIRLLRWEELVIKKKKARKAMRSYESRIWRRSLGWNREGLSILYPTLRLNEKLSFKNWVLGTQYLDLGRLGEPTKYTQVQEQEVDVWKTGGNYFWNTDQCAVEMVLWVKAQNSISRNPSSRTERIPQSRSLTYEHSCSWKHKHTMCGLERWLSS